MDDLGSVQNAVKIRALLAASVRYKMDRLKLVCESSLCGCASLNASTVVAMLALAEQLQIPTLRSACIKFIASSAGQIRSNKLEGNPNISLGSKASTFRVVAKCPVVATNFEYCRPDWATHAKAPLEAVIIDLEHDNSNLNFR
ncbi:hypothetical protein EJB05_08958, partial [Eragrostis curvula]